MGKQRKTVSLSEENAEFLTNHHNASALVDELVTEYRTGGREEKTILRYRLEELESEIASLESRAEHKKDLRNEIESRVSRQTEQQQRTVEEAVETLVGEITDVQAEHWADKADMSVSEFKEAYNEARDQ